MHIPVIYRESRPWPRVKNHFDSRKCPDCGLPAYGSDGQRDHRRYHEKLQQERIRNTALLAELCKRTGITEEEVASHIGQDWSWGAQVTGVEAEIEGSSGA